ncbi:hemagglutinin repeat-containing protein [Xylella taiwanensis]|uniref:two-partner secretion domain-containing protein n=1 Tax=Xylella taiwanensis TaxID=1444770 RepID=UPI001E385A0B|nr:hemagglutinin repeat-containing protein [Xylella taiwanensis]MCD8466591.1 hemagglutinin repeat-containing protein [Xylella taiwanensis]
MNKDLYRLIYNRALRLWQVASELAVPRGSAAGTSPQLARRQTAQVRAVSFGLWLSLGWVGVCSLAGAQVVADPQAPGTQRPTILEASPGVALINIQTPSQAGVSRNTYQQLDVGASGAILNNARTQTQTHLGGWVPGNPWLATGTARVILNEVNSAQPSQLHGMVEVAGARAQVIIANPSGITCSGCGVLNASRFTLSTGAPEFDAGGALESYRVQGGAIRLDGAGLDSRTADYTALITRSIQLNAGLWAQQLQGSIGAASVPADGSAAVSLPGAAAPPAFALDVSALGGMYAGKITLIGTEHGLGVRHAGAMTAQSGELVVTVDGRLDNSGRLQAATDTHLNATQGVGNSGLISAAQTLHLHTQADIDNRSGTLNAARLDLSGATLDNRGGRLEQTGAQPLSIQAQQFDNQAQGRLGAVEGPSIGQPPSTDLPTGPSAPPVAVEPPGSPPPSVAIEPPGNDTSPLPASPPAISLLADGRLTLESDIDNRGGLITAGGAINATLSGLDNRHGHAALNQLTLQGQGLDNRHGILHLAAEALIHSQVVNNAAGQLQASGALDLNTQQFNNRGGQFLHTGPQAAHLRIDGLLDNQHGVLASAANALTLQTGQLTNDAGQLQASGALALNTQQFSNRGGQFLHTGAQAAHLRIDGLLDNQHGVLASAANALTLQTGQLTNDAGQLQASGALDLQTHQLNNRGGQLLHTGPQAAHLRIDGLLDNTTGTLSSTGSALTLNATTLDNSGGTVQHSGQGSLQIDAATLFGPGGTLSSQGALSITGTQTDLSQGTTWAQHVSIRTGVLSTAGGQLTAQSDQALQLEARTRLDNRGGSIATNGVLDLHTATLDNRGGTLHSTGPGASRLEATQALDNRGGHLLLTGPATLTTGTWDNTQGQLLLSGPGTLHASTLDNRGGVLHTATGLLDLHVTGTLNNQDNGTLSSGQDLRLSAATVFNQHGTLDAAGAAQLHLSGLLQSREALWLSSAGLTNRAGTLSGAQVTLYTQNQPLDNRGGRLGSTSGTVTLHSGVLDNRAGLVQAATALRIDTGPHLLDNSAGGALLAGGALDLRSATLDNHGGQVFSQAATQLHSTHIDNTAGGQLGGANGLQIDAHTLSNTGGRLHSGADARLHLDNRLDNHDGLISAAGALAITTTTLDNRTTPAAPDPGSRPRDTAAPATGLHATHLQIDSTTLDNRDGHLSAAQDIALTLRGALQNTAGRLTAGGTLQLSAAQLTNQAGTLLSGGAQSLHLSAFSGAGLLHAGTALTLALQEGLDNGGTLSAAGLLTVRTAGALHNRGLIQAADLTLQAQRIDNVATGQMAASGQAQLSAADTFSNAGLLHTGDLTLHAQNIDNAATGQMAASGQAQLTATETLTNSGLLQGRDLTLQARTIDNAATGQMTASGQAQLTATETLTNSGLLQGRDLTLHAQNIDNVATGQMAASGQAQLTATETLSNSGLLQGRDLTLQAQRIDNVATGQMAASGQAQLTATATLSNSGLLQGRDLTLHAQRIDNAAAAQILASGQAQLSAADTFSNAGLLHTGDLTLQARTIDNAATGQITASGQAQLTATATLSNRGLIDAATTHLQAATLDNIGTARLYGDHLALQAQTLTNRDESTAGQTHAATIAARERLDIGAATVRNSGAALIYSAGDAAIGGTLDSDRHATGSATLLDNRSATIDVDGALDITTTTLNNIRDNVHLTQAPGVSTTVRMSQPAWRDNQRNNDADFTLTSNYDAHEIYYLNPNDILQDEPYTTPDGYIIHRAVVRLTPQTSAYLYARGGLYAARGQRQRLDLSQREGIVVLYYTDRQDQQPNPDQVQSAARQGSAWAGLDTPQKNERQQDVHITYQDEVLTYDPAYGTCRTDCVRLITWRDYTDPDHTLTHMRRGPTDVKTNEQYRHATKTTVDDILQPGVGAAALIQSGGAMFVQVDRLANHYADILAGGDQTIVGLPPHPPKDPEKAPEYSKASLIDNLTAELSRTTQFNNISYTYAGAAETWTMPSQRYTIGQIGGRITSGGHQYIAAVDVNNRLQSLHTTTHVEHPPLGDLHTSPPMPLMPELTPAPSTDQSAEEPALSVESQLPLTIPDTTLQDLADARLPTLHTDNAPISVAAPPWATATTVPGPLILPNNRLFTVHPDAVSLIVTDPHFSGGSDRTTADRQLQALNDPLASMHKRLGDGFYEQRLIREQIAQLTGRRLLDGYANDDQQYRALLDAGVTVAQHYGLRPGIALSADQMAQLTSDIVWLVEQPVTLPNGTSTTALVPRVYLRPRRGDLKTDGALMAGARLTMDLSGTLSNTGTLTGRDRLTIDADNIHQEGGQMDADHVKVHTKDTLTDIGGTFSARSSLDVTAAGGLIARSTTRGYSTSGQRHFSRTEIDRPSAFRVTGPGGTLHVTSDKDMTLQGVTFSNTGPGGTSTVTAAGKLNMATVAVGETNTATLGPGNSIHSTRDSEVGTRITGTGNVTIKGEGGVIGRAVTLDSRQGKLNISSADGTVALVAGQERRTGQEERTSRRSGLWGSSRSHSTASSQDTIALGSVLGGTKVTVTGDKVYSVGTDFIADGNPHIEGTHGVGMFGAQNTHSSSYSTTQRRSGVFGSGAGFTVGSQKASQQGSRHATYLTGNTVAALNGNIFISSSKGAVQAPGIDLIAAGNINVSGVNVTMDPVYDTASAQQQQASKHSGFSVGFSSALGTFAQAVPADIRNARHAPTGQLSTLYGVRALNSAFSAGDRALDEIKTLREGGIPHTFGGGVSFGSTTSQSQTSMTATTARGAQLRAGGKVSVTAFGIHNEKGERQEGTGQLSAVGAQISSGSLAFNAAGDLILHSVQSTQEHTSSQRYSSSTVGAQWNVGSSSPSLNAGGARGRGQSSQQSVTQVDTAIRVSGNATLNAGGNAQLRGAHVLADSINGTIGGNLDIESRQDTLRASSQQRQNSAGATLVMSGLGSNATFSHANQHATQDYASVRDQSGLFAGAGGYTIHVGGHTQLDGGAIVSSAPQALQKLSTQSMGHSTVDNHHNAGASASGFTLSSDLVSGLSQGNSQLPIYSLGRTLIGQHMGSADRQVNDRSTTEAVVSAANIVLRGGDPAPLATLRRDPDGAHTPLAATDLGTLQADVQHRSQAGALLADSGRILIDQGLSNILSPTLEKVFCVSQPCTNDHAANNTLVEERTAALRQAHPGWSDKRLREQAVNDLTDTIHDANRTLDATKVAEFIAGTRGPNDDLLTDQSRWALTGGVANIQAIPVTLDALRALADEEKKNSTVFGNGISNLLRRAAELGLQMTPWDRNKGNIQDTGETYVNTTYVVHTQPTHTVGELIVAGLEKLMEVSNGRVVSPASRLQAQVAETLMYNEADKQYTNPVNFVGHSRGTMTETGALNVLAALGVKSDELKIFVNNPAAEESRLTAVAGQVTKNKPGFWSPPNDFVAHIIGGYPGTAGLKDLREIFETNYSVHSSGGTAALGSHPDNVNPEGVFSYAGLDIDEMNRKRHDQTMAALQQWQAVRRPEDPVATQLAQLQRLLDQSAYWQQQLDGTPGMLTPFTPASPPTGTSRQQQLQQLRQQLTPAE